MKHKFKIGTLIKGKNGKELFKNDVGLVLDNLVIDNCDFYKIYWLFFKDCQGEANEEFEGKIKIRVVNYINRNYEKIV